jgi:hypothetical protein
MQPTCTCGHDLDQHEWSAPMLCAVAGCPCEGFEDVNEVGHEEDGHG